MGPEKLSFSIKEALEVGWQTTTANLRLLLILVVFFIGLAVVDGVLGKIFEDDPLLSFLVGLAYAVVNTVIGIGWLKILLRLIDKQPASFSDLFSVNFQLVINFAAATILGGLLALGGLFLLIIPGLYLLLGFAFVQYFVVDKDAGPVEALRRSLDITKGIKLKLLGFWFVLGLLNLLGFFAFIIGMLITVPATSIAQAYVYRKLLSQVEAPAA